MISTERKFIFLHPERTGGTSIEKVLEPYSDNSLVPMGGHGGHVVMDRKGREIKHSWLWFFYEELGERLSDYYIFATTRNPWERVVSSWFYFQQEWVAPQVKEFERFAMEGLSGFYMSVGGYSGPLPTIPVSPVSDLTEVPGVEASIVFIEYARLQEDFDRVCREIGVPHQKLPHINRTPREHYSIYYTRTAQEVVAEAFKSDIDRFGYQFERKQRWL